MAQSGYYRFPTIHDDTVVFASEDDLWSVPASGGIARRLTSSLSEAARPLLSPDGNWLAFMAREEGHYEVYAMPAAGGEAKRLTFFGSTTRPAAWSRDSSEIYFVSNYRQPFAKILKLHAVAPDGGTLREIPVGPASSISFGPGTGVVIGRNTADPATWKRYRGGTAGDLWIDETGTGEFHRLITLRGNLAAPMWVGDRIYFVSDHEGYGNIYSCTPGGEDLRRHTDHEDFYARNPSTDGRRIVYHAGADLYLLDPAGDSYGKIPVTFHSPRTQLSRKFIQAADYLQHYALHPEGQSTAMVLRGKPVVMGNFSGPATQLGEMYKSRYRLAEYLNDGKRLVAVNDRENEDAIVLLDIESGEESRIEGIDIGRPMEMAVAPTGERVAISNHRNEILVVDLITRQMTSIDKSSTLHHHGIAWSPDGRWLAFNHADNPQTSYLMIADVGSGAKHQITEPVLHDIAPAFDPDGKYLYFISYRDFDPVYDNLHFDLGFPRGARPYLITLTRDLIDPFLVKPQMPKKPLEKELMAMAEGEKEKGEAKAKEVAIDVEGITRRVVPFPVADGRYSMVMGAKGKVYFVSHPISGSLGSVPGNPEQQPDGTLECYDLEAQRNETVVAGINEFTLSRNGSTLIYRSGKRLRVLAVGSKPDPNAGNDPGRETGWLDLSRPRVPIIPSDEWQQMFSEAWRLQREYFWTEGMLGLNWDHVHALYKPLVERIGARSEFSDIIWEMHGELGTSHAYESGGDYRRAPAYAQGFLGADYRYDEGAGGWVISHIARGDAWSEEFGSPLELPGINIGEGDRLVAINGRKLDRDTSPQEQLVHTAATEVAITFIPKGGTEPQTATVKTLRAETKIRYREWVNANRRKVHQATGGKVGYIHIPDMGPFGYSEFHRGFLSEVGHGSLIVDVRYNGGGHVSQLLLEKLARKPLGYDLPRYGMPETYPSYATGGPIVAITNESAGSDGDIFSHSFKLMKLGPLIGKRTWGGVVGISPRNPLADGSMTTQPEFSTWFQDVQWGVENYGTDPDIDIDITPQDYAAGRDPQLDRAITEVLRMLQEKPYTLPDFKGRPVLTTGPLPKRALPQPIVEAELP